MLFVKCFCIFKMLQGPFPYKCKSCAKDEKSKWRSEYACKECRREIRNFIATIPTFDALIKMQCPGHGKSNVTKITKTGGWGLFSTGSYAKHWEENRTLPFNTGCLLCSDEVRKECDLRASKVSKQKKAEKLKKENLKDRCAKVIALDPGLILVAATHDPPVEEHLWKIIHDQIPAANNKEYKESLEQSLQNNNSEWMYQTVGTVFSRYVGKNKRRKV